MLLTGLGAAGLVMAQPSAGPGARLPEGPSQERAAEAGIPVTDAAVVRHCVACHRMDDDGRMTRISFVRKTPEGWQQTIRRMVMLEDVGLEPEPARQIVRYLANDHGLAPEEARPGAFEVERRLIDHDYPDDDTEEACINCHSMGRVITQRRSREEWQLLMATHRAYYPLADFQGLMEGGSSSDDAEGQVDRRQPMDKAVDHLSRAFPLETPEWAAWSATKRPPRLAGQWLMEGHEPGAGPVYGTLTLEAVAGAADEFRTAADYVYPRSGREARRSGRGIVYTGFQWRGRSFAVNGGDGADRSGASSSAPAPPSDAPPASDGPALLVSQDEAGLREVMFVERDWRRLSGRWFTGGYDELGLDVSLRRVEGTMVAGVWPRALRRGAGSQTVRIYGAGLPQGLDVDAVDFGPGIAVEEVLEAGATSAAVRLSVAADAAVGARDLFVAGAGRPEAAIVYEGVHALQVRPEWGMARVGGVVAPKRHVQFEAVAFDRGPDGEVGTDDDLEVGIVDARWTLEEYAVTFEDDDVRFVGDIDPSGLFTPAVDGPNPERPGNRNNVGDVWVVATYDGPDLAAPRPLRARAHLLVTVPLYLNWGHWEIQR